MPAHEVMTVGELGDYLRCHPSTIYRLLKQRALPAFKIGSDWRFNREAIDRWRQSQEGETGTASAPARSAAR